MFLENNHEVFVIVELVFEKVEHFKYLGTTIKCNIDRNIEIVNPIKKAEKAYSALITFLKPNLKKKKSKFKLYMAVIRPTEVWM